MAKTNSERNPKLGTGRRIPAVRPAVGRETLVEKLGPLSELAGTWQGTGFNLIARPDFEGKGALFLELNQTIEVLKFEPIGSPIPNRGSAQQDIELFGLTYLQTVIDSVTGGALHIEPGVWITQPRTTAPPETPPAGSSIVARLATVPHGSAVLAEGLASSMVITGGTFRIPPVNTAPFPAGTAMPPGGTQGAFPPYDLEDTSPAAVNFRTPFGNTPAIPLPATIDSIGMQDVINDPTRLLQQAIRGHFIEKVIRLQIATTPELVPYSGGGIENIPFLAANADAALMFATFWIERIRHPARPIMQLQYAQTVILNFPILDTTKNFGWPHVSVATLQKTFG